jgi:hypothetical protein
MGARYKHKNVDTTGSVILTYSWIKVTDVPLFDIICNHAQTKHLVSKFFIRQSRVPVPRTYVPTVPQLKPMHARLQQINSDARNGEREIRVSCSRVFKHMTLFSCTRHINTRHEDSILLDQNFVTRHYTVAKQLIWIKNMPRSHCL